MNDIKNLQELRQTINHILCSEDGITQSVMPNVPKMLAGILYKQRLGVKILDKLTQMNDDKEQFSHLRARVKSAFNKDAEDIESEEEDVILKEDTQPHEEEEKEEMDEDDALDQQIHQETHLKEGLDEFDDEDDDDAGYGDSDEEDVSMGTNSASKPEKTENDEDEETKVENPLAKPPPKLEPNKVCYFLNDLIYEKLDTNPLFEKGNKEEIEREFDRRYLFRQRIKRELDTRCDLFGLKECALVCSKCESILCYLNNLEVKKESAGICEIKGMLCGLTETRGAVKNHPTDKFVRETLKRMQNEEDYDFLTCHYNHICGLRVKFKYYFTKDSPILFKFPMGSKREWSPEMWKNQFAEACEQEQLTKNNIDWSNIPEEDRYCTICNRQFNSAQELVDHCERDETHEELSTRFLLK